ncbi:MAG: alpha-L-fucosidase [Kiritimatiellae bacterium]|nr:alpha-L-fucosidase [Kiritimatiellia bacterium]
MNDETELHAGDAGRCRRGMKFGLMMHWGLYSVAGGVWKGRNIPGYNEQIMHRAKIAWPEYKTLLDGFTAAQWDADAIVRMAMDAGMSYIVITSKHHDGFNLWHTRHSEFNAVDATPARRDVLKELSDACARRNMAFGVYYSLIDWHCPGAAPMSETNSDPITPALERFTMEQLRELMSDYGPLREIWFDMGAPTPEQSRKFADLVHAMQPGCRVNGRIWNGCDDFMECGDNETPDFWLDGPWESSVSMFHETWGYRSWQERGKVADKVREKIRELASVTARGGDYLLNIGPRGDGSIVEFDAAVLAGIGQWMRVHGEAVFDGEPQPRLPLDFGYATGRPGRLYLYVVTPPADGMLRVPGWRIPSVCAHLLAQPKATPLEAQCVGGTLEIALPGCGLDPNLPVVALDYVGAHPYLPRGAIGVTGRGTVSLAHAAALPWSRLEGHDYYSQKRFVVAREWVLWPETACTVKLMARRPAGGAHAEFRVCAAGRETRCIFPQSGAPQSQVCLDITLAPDAPVTIALRDIAPRGELRGDGLVLEVTECGR